MNYDSSQRADSKIPARSTQHSESESAGLMHRLRQLESVMAALNDRVDALEGERRHVARVLQM